MKIQVYTQPLKSGADGRLVEFLCWDFFPLIFRGEKNVSFRAGLTQGLRVTKLLTDKIGKTGRFSIVLHWICFTYLPVYEKNINFINTKRIFYLLPCFWPGFFRCHDSVQIFEDQLFCSDQRMFQVQRLVESPQLLRWRLGHRGWLHLHQGEATWRRLWWEFKQITWRWLEKHHFFHRRYIFKWLFYPIVTVIFGGVKRTSIIFRKSPKYLREKKPTVLFWGFGFWMSAGHFVGLLKEIPREILEHLTCYAQQHLAPVALFKFSHQIIYLKKSTWPTTQEPMKWAQKTSCK